MPWKECHLVDERLRFVARLLDGEKMAPLCVEFGISRKTAYKIFDRSKDCGITGLTDRSRRPYRHANQLPIVIEKSIVVLKLREILEAPPGFVTTDERYAHSDSGNRTAIVPDLRHFSCLTDHPLMPPVREEYRDYRPPTWVGKIVRRLLGSLSEQHVGGLSGIVLTESALIRKGRTRRVGGKKYAMQECLGFYRPRSHRGSAMVVLVVDNIVGARLPRYWQMPFFREWLVGDVLFHEIGHHLNHTRRSVVAGEEASADAWELRLSRVHYRKRYWYLRPLNRQIVLIWGWMARDTQRRRASWRSHRVAG